MDRATKLQLLEQGLTRAAEALGDITAPVIAEFYRRHPECLPAFDRLGLGKREHLEGEMVAQAVYCLMTWFETPGEVEVVLWSSVPHHAQTLEVLPAWYEGLLASACTVLGAFAVDEERAIWVEVEHELRALVRYSAA